MVATDILLTISGDAQRFVSSRRQEVSLATSKQGSERTQPRRLLTTGDLAELLGMTRTAIYNMRSRGGGPRWIRIEARSVRYRPEDVEAWLEECAAATAAQAPPAA
jgi:predicted DNA-binding transcriptional regulator AlpA